MNISSIIGAEAENHALTFLQNNGLSLIDRNYRTRAGEIDLIMKDKNVIVFIEVKFRQSDAYGDPGALVSYAKQKRIIRTATQFLVEKNLYETTDGRFDVIGILLKNPSQPAEITWIKNAFEVKYS